MKDLKENQSYLIKRTSSSSLISITVMKKTEKAYLIRWNNHPNYDAFTWEEIDHMQDTYKVVEIITDVQTNLYDQIKFNQKNQTRMEFEVCKTCMGTGNVEDRNSTSMTKTCIICWGSGVIKKLL